MGSSIPCHSHLRSQLRRARAGGQRVHDARVGAAGKAIRNREQTRLVSCSQPLADKWQTNKSASTPSGLFLAALQYGTDGPVSLYLSCALEANRALERHGQQPDWLGDHTHDSTMAAGERNVRHDVGNLAWYQPGGAGVRDGTSSGWRQWGGSYQAHVARVESRPTDIQWSYP